MPGWERVSRADRVAIPAGRFRVVDWAQPAGARLGWHDHDAASLSLSLAGRYAESYRERVVECQRFDVVVKPAGERHRDAVGDDPARCLLVELPADDPALARYVRRLSEPAVWRGGWTQVLIARVVQELERADPWSGLALEALLLELVVAAARGARCGGRRPPAWLRRAAECLTQGPGSPRIATVAAECGVHPAHLARAFRRHFGCTLGDYARRARLERAVGELLREDASVADVAARAGFCDQSHFGRALRRACGISPGELRRIGRAAAARIRVPGRA